MAHFLHAGEIGWVPDAEVVAGTNARTSALREDGCVDGYLPGQVVSSITGYLNAVADNIRHCGLHRCDSVEQSCSKHRSGDLPRS